MATKRRKKPVTTRRRRRVSGIGGAQMSGIIYVLGGAIAAQAIDKFLPTTMDSKLRAAIPVVAGYFAPKFIKGANGVALSSGMIAVGGLHLVQTFGLLNGLMDGMGDMPMLGAYSRRRQINGMNGNMPMVGGGAAVKETWGMDDFMLMNQA